MHTQLHAKPAHALPRVQVRSRAPGQLWPRAASCKTASRKNSFFSRLNSRVRCAPAQTAPREFALFPVASVSGSTIFGYAEANPVSFTDPTGRVTWKGWARSIGVGPYQREEYTLTSECACGLEIKVKIQVDYGGIGIGAITQNWYASLADKNKCPDANAFMGPAYSYSAAAAAKWGFAYSRTRIGAAESVGWDVIQGLGGAIGVASGIPSVEVLEVKKCDECKK